MELATIDGVEIAYRADGAESGVPVVLIHGYTGNHRNWAWTAKALLGAGHRTLSPDNPGHGESGAPEDFQAYALERVAEMIHGLAVGLDFDPAVIVGHSMGGAIAEAYAVNHPASVRALVLVDSAGGASGPERIATHIDDLRQAYAGGGMEAVFERQVELGLRPGIDAGGASMRALVKREFAQTSWSGFEFGGLALRTRGETLSRLAAFTRPALVVHGAGESEALVRVADDLERALPNVERHVIPNAGHSPQFEAADAFNAVLLDFLARHSH